MYVLQKYQGKNYGRTLFNHALKKAKENGYRYIRLYTTKDLVKAINLHRSANFYEIEGYNNNNIADVFMELKIK